jgi:hypothetical protein
MANKVVQSDNAVVDYTTIQSLITAVNDLVTEVNTISSKNQGSVTVQNPDGTTTLTKKGTQAVDSGHVSIPATGKTVKVTFGKTFSSRPDVTATVMFSKAPIYAYLAGSAALTTSGAEFSLSADPNGSAVLYWIAVGIEA